MLAITLLSLQYAAFNIYKRIREHSVKISDRQGQSECRATRLLYRFVLHIILHPFLRCYFYIFTLHLCREILQLIFFFRFHV